MTNIDIRIIGTSQDVKLLKKILNFYFDNKAMESEKHHIETYLGLIDHAVKKAKENSNEIRLFKSIDSR